MGNKLFIVLMLVLALAYSSKWEIMTITADFLNTYPELNPANGNIQGQVFYFRRTFFGLTFHIVPYLV